MRRKVCVVITARPSYSRIRSALEAIRAHPALELQLVVAASALLERYGDAHTVIEKEGFTIDRRVFMILEGENLVTSAKSTGLGLAELATVFYDLQPDVVVTIADRFETIATAIAASYMNIPLLHIQGGEITGSIDEKVRHAVTKLATVHFASTEAYRNRILQMGENPDLTFNVGAPGIDAIYKLTLLERSELEAALEFSLEGVVAVVTYHPVTTERGAAKVQVENLLGAIEASGIRAVFTKANADPEGGAINRRLSEFCGADPTRFKLFDNLGQKRYLSCMKTLDLMIGNSSSGLIEAPSFWLPVVNVGDRQKGRVRARNVIDVGNGIEQISDGISRALSTEFRKSLDGIENPYDRFRDGMTSRRIKEALKTLPLSESLVRKEFRDLM